MERMMRETFFKKLQENLEVAYTSEEAAVIIKDYEELFDDYIAQGLSEVEAISKLGDPKDIVRALIEENKKIMPSRTKDNVTLPRRGGTKFIAAAPLLAVIIYMLLGFLLDAWHPGWLIFFIIPVSAILFTPYRKAKLVALSPFIAITIFILLGTYVPHVYTYGWIIFLIIPLFGIFARK